MSRQDCSGERSTTVSDISDSDTEMASAESFSSYSIGSRTERSPYETLPGRTDLSRNSENFRFSNNSAFQSFSLNQTTENFRETSAISLSARAAGNRDNRMTPELVRNDPKEGISSNFGLSYANFSTPTRPLHYPKSYPSNISNDTSAFLHSDIRVPFANYFNNLVKVLQTAAANGELGKSRNLGKNQRNAFDFYWNKNTEICDKDKCCTESLKDNSSWNGSPESAKSTSEKRAVEDMEISSSQRHSSTPPSLNTTETSSEGSPILSGHFPRSSECQSGFSCTNQLLAQYPTHSGVSGPAYTRRGCLHPAAHHPYFPIAGFQYQRTNGDKQTPVKKYKCDVCGKSFSRSNTLVTHKRIHTGAKPFKCEICGRAFRQPGNLTRHRLTHTSVKPYVCPQCNKAFNRASNLNTHMRTHSNHRQFSGNMDRKSFSARSDPRSPFFNANKRVGSFRH